MSPKVFRAVLAVSQGGHTTQAATSAGTDAKEGAVPCPPDPHHPTPTFGDQCVVGCTGQEEAQHSPRQHPLRQGCCWDCKTLPCTVFEAGFRQRY